MSDPVLRSITVATDLTRRSDPVLQAAAALAERSGGKLHVLHALGDHSATYGASAGSKESADRVLAAERSLDAQIARTVGATSAIASTTVELCPAAPAVCHHAEEHGADLIVLGSGTGRGYRRARLGWGMVARVLHGAGTPCLVVVCPLRLPLRRIVVPVDLAEPGSRSIACAIGWAEAFGRRSSLFEAGDEVELCVVHVLTGLLGAELGIERALIGPELHPTVRAALHCSDPPAGVAITQELLLDVVPGRSIARYAVDRQADLIVLGQQRRPALRHWFGRGTILTVLRNHPCGVLVLPAPSLARGRAPLTASAPRVHAEG